MDLLLPIVYPPCDPERDEVDKKTRLIRSVHLMAVLQAVIENKTIVLLGFPVIFCWLSVSIHLTQIQW